MEQVVVSEVSISLDRMYLYSLKLVTASLLSPTLVTLLLRLLPRLPETGPKSTRIKPIRTS